MWDQLTIGYLAALIDGEGYIRLSKQGVAVLVGSTDLDIVQRAHDMSGIGTIQGPYLNKNRTKPNWRWAVTAKSDVARLLCAIAPLMSERKRTTQILPVAEYLSAHIPRQKNCEVCGTAFIPEDGKQLRRKHCKPTCGKTAWKIRQKQTKLTAG